MNATQRGILFGMLLGDGCIKPKPHTLKDGTKKKYYEFVVSHSSKQKEYIEHKLEIFHSIVGGKKPKLCSSIVNLKGVKHQNLRFSRQQKYFKLMHRLAYPDSKKTFTRRILDFLNPQGLALWYMDDGGLSKNKNKRGEVSSLEMRLFTYCSEKEADIIINYFSEVWGITPKKRCYKKNNSWNIIFNTRESHKFEMLIKDFMINSMQYKLPRTWVTRVQDTLTG